MLFLDPSEILNHFVSILVVGLNKLLVVIELLNVVIDYSLHIVFEDIHFPAEEVNITLEFVVVRSLDFIIFVQVLDCAL